MGPILLYFAVQVGVPPAFVVALALRWMYLRSVRRSMLRSRAAAPADEASRVAADPPSQPLAIVPAAAPPRAAARGVWRGPWIAVAVHVCAGLAYALGMTWLWAHVSGIDFSWVLLPFTLFFAWPLVIVLSLVATVTWRGVALIVLIYAALFLLIVVWVTHETTMTVSQIALVWWNNNGIATLLLLAFLARPIKAMGPIVVALVMAGVAAMFETADILSNQDVVEWVALMMGRLGFSGTVGGYAAAVILFGLAAIVAILMAYVVLRGTGRLYRAQWISDQSI